MFFSLIHYELIVSACSPHQQVIYRRFQVKLQRSKIANARLRGDNEIEKELRSVSMRRLHSESHLMNGGDGEFLSKLEKRPYGGNEAKKFNQGTTAKN